MEIKNIRKLVLQKGKYLNPKFTGLEKVNNFQMSELISKEQEDKLFCLD